MVLEKRCTPSSQYLQLRRGTASVLEGGELQGWGIGRGIATEKETRCSPSVPNRSLSYATKPATAHESGALEKPSDV